MVDIDSDLISDGKLEPIPTRATANARSDNPQSAEPSPRIANRDDGRGGAASAAPARPRTPTKPTGAPDRAKKLSS